MYEKYIACICRIVFRYLYIDVSYIPKEIIKPIPADLRIIVESNANSLYNLSFNHPNGKELSNTKNVSKNVARLQQTDYMLSEFQVKDANLGGILLN